MSLNKKLQMFTTEHLPGCLNWDILEKYNHIPGYTNFNQTVNFALNFTVYHVSIVFNSVGNIMIYEIYVKLHAKSKI